MAYESGWSPIVEFQTGAEVNNKLTTAFNAIDAVLGKFETAEPIVYENKVRIDALEADRLMQYEFGKAENLTIIEDTFQPVATVSIAILNTGIFEYKMSLRFKYSNTSTSAVFRYAIVRNGDANPTWYEIWHEVKDATNDDIIAFGFPLDEANGDSVEFKLEARCETTGHQLDIEYADMIIDQKR